MNGRGFGSLGKAISDVLATSMHHALQMIVPRWHDEAAERRAGMAEDATNTASDLLGPIFGRIHGALEDDHPLKPVAGLLAGKHKS